MKDVQQAHEPDGSTCHGPCTRAWPAPGEPQVMHDDDMTSVVKDLLAVDHGDLDLFVVENKHREEAGPVILDG